MGDQHQVTHGGREHGSGLASRWWGPGAVVAAGVLVVATVVTAGWNAYEAGGCGSPTAKFACLVESLVAMAVAVVAVPLLLWWAFRRAGVRRPFLSVLVAAGVALPLLAVPALGEQVALLAGYEVSDLDGLPAPAVGVWLGLAALGGGLALQGPHRRLRSGGAALALAALVGATSLLVGPAERARDGLDLDRAQVPLLLAPGWQASGLYVSEDGTLLRYDAVPLGWDGYGFDGVPVELSTSLDEFGEDCSWRRCTDVGDVRVSDPDSSLGTTLWRVVDGTLATVEFWDPDEESVPADPVELLGRLEPVDREEFLDRRYDQP